MIGAWPFPPLCGGCPGGWEPHLVLQVVPVALVLHPLLQLQLLHGQHALVCLPQPHGLLEVAEEFRALPLRPLG